MTTSRLQEIFSAAPDVTKETILAKLNTDLSTSERKDYLETLFQSPETTHLLNIVTLEWQKILLAKQMQIEMLNERIRIANCYIDAYKERSDPFTMAEQIKKMQEQIEKDAHAIKLHEMNLHDSSKRAIETLEFVKPMLDAMQKTLFGFSENNNQLKLNETNLDASNKPADKKLKLFQSMRSKMQKILPSFNKNNHQAPVIGIELQQDESRLAMKR